MGKHQVQMATPFVRRDELATAMTSDRRSVTAPKARTHLAMRSALRLAFRRLAARLAAITDLKARPEGAVVARYGGWSWCDFTERALTDDLTGRHGKP